MSQQEYLPLRLKTEQEVQLGFRPEDWNIKEEPFSNSFPVELFELERSDMKILNLALDNISLTMKTDQNLFKKAKIFSVSEMGKHISILKMGVNMKTDC